MAKNSKTIRLRDSTVVLEWDEPRSIGFTVYSRCGSLGETKEYMLRGYQSSNDTTDDLRLACSLVNGFVRFPGTWDVRIHPGDEKEWDITHLRELYLAMYALLPECELIIREEWGDDNGVGHTWDYLSLFTVPGEEFGKTCMVKDPRVAVRVSKKDGTLSVEACSGPTQIANRETAMRMLGLQWPTDSHLVTIDTYRGV